jgi:phosphopantothenoylcysteine decarboxylase/phosphopantothenate--cysteine ligase
VTRIDVESAADMEAPWPPCAEADVVVMAAAVADFRPKAIADRKLSKEDGTAGIGPGADARHPGRPGRASPPGQVLVGFAAETNDVSERGRRKLRRKGVDCLVVNDVSAPGAGFDHDTNAVSSSGRTAAPPKSP